MTSNIFRPARRRGRAYATVTLSARPDRCQSGFDVVKIVSPLMCIAALLTFVPASHAAAGPPPRACVGSALDDGWRPDGSLAPASVTPPAAGSVAAPDNLCWTDVEPYPFGRDGEPVDTTAPGCQVSVAGAAQACYLTITSFAFRAPNRGLAAATNTDGTPNTTPFGVWLYNGARWFPDPTFPGKRICRGGTVLWAGKRDYWLIGPSLFDTARWPSLCRFDGASFEWQPLALPTATINRVTRPDGTLLPGGITSGACRAWNDCWFFGSYGTRVRWDGTALTDASVDPGEPWRDSEIEDALVRTDSQGNVFGLALGAASPGSAATGSLSTRLASPPDGSLPMQALTYAGTSWTPLPFTLPTVPVVGDPLRTDAVAATLDQDGIGWGVGNPTGVDERHGAALARPPIAAAMPAPAFAVSALGGEPDCPSPSLDRFVVRPSGGGASTIWSGVAGADGAAYAIASGSTALPPGSPPVGDGQQEPMLARLACGAPASQVVFREPDPTFQQPDPRCGTGHHPPCVPPPLVPADRDGWATAVAADAPNHAWATTTGGFLGDPSDIFREPPHLYELSDALAPAAPLGDDVEDRPLPVTADQTIFVFAPPPPPAPAPAARIKLKAPIHRIRVRYKNLILRVSFTVRYPIRIGLEAKRSKLVVGRTGLHAWVSGSHTLVLRLDPKRWPTAIRFVQGAS
jgi:hypothetical protein